MFINFKLKINGISTKTKPTLNIYIKDGKKIAMKKKNYHHL